MADPYARVAYLSLFGEVQDDIVGDTNFISLEGLHKVYGFDHQLNWPIDATGGGRTGPRQHHPMILTLGHGLVSHCLVNALHQNEQLSGELFFTREYPPGTFEKYYSIVFDGAFITGIKSVKLNSRYPENNDIGILLNVALTYTNITWTYVPIGSEATDAWGSL